MTREQLQSARAPWNVWDGLVLRSSRAPEIHVYRDGLYFRVGKQGGRNRRFYGRRSGKTGGAWEGGLTSKPSVGDRDGTSSTAGRLCHEPLASVRRPTLLLSPCHLYSAFHCPSKQETLV